jgi:hypothetical protein
MAQISARPVGPTLDLPRGLALNRFRLNCPGMHQMTRLPRPDSREARENLERSIGEPVFQKGNSCYAGPDVSASDSQSVDLPCSFDRQLHAFDLRRCIFEHASKEKFDVRFGFAGLITITGLAEDVEIDGLRVQRRLRLRVAIDGFEASDTWVIARHDTRYLVAGSLQEATIASRAVGEVADRIAGDGPTKGEVASVSTHELVLLTRGRNVIVEPSDYTLTVRAPYIRRYHKRDTFTRLQVISGSLTQAGRKNRYAVKDRYKNLINDMEKLHYEIPMPNGRYATIERAWTEIRIQEGSW